MSRKVQPLGVEHRSVYLVWVLWQGAGEEELAGIYTDQKVADDIVDDIMADASTRLVAYSEEMYVDQPPVLPAAQA